jgi:hypothetical protein
MRKEHIGPNGQMTYGNRKRKKIITTTKNN